MILNKFTEKINVRKIGIAFMAAFVFVQFLLMSYYEWTYFYLYLTGDIAGDLILADYMAELGEWVICSEWIFGSEIHLLHNHLIMVPLFHITSSYRMVMLGAFVIGTILILILCFMVTYKLGNDIFTALLCMALMLAPKTELYAMGFQPLFAWAYIFATLAFWTLFLQWKKNGNKVIMLLLSLLALFMGMCGLRFFIILFVPFLLCYCWDFFKKNLKAERIKVCKKELTEVMIVMCAAVAGFAIFYLYIAKRYGAGTAVGTLWVPGKEVMENFLYAPFALIECFGGFLRENSVISAHGIAQIAIYMATVAFFFVLAYSYGKDSGKYNERTLQMRKFLIVTILANLIMIGFTNMGQVWGRLMEIHYLSLALILFFPVLCAILKQSNINKTFKYFFVFLSVTYIVASDAYYFAGAEEVGIPSYAEWLEESGYEYGWSYNVWDGLETVAFTDGEIEVCHVKTPEYSTENIQLSKKSWATKKPEFMLIPTEENAELILKNCPYTYKMVYTDDDMSIYELSEE